jgi:hypothetical protein
LNTAVRPQSRIEKSMKLIVPPVSISADDGFKPDIDIFNRKPFGENLLNLILNTDDKLVLALDAPWGEGKSTFIRMWRGLLKQNDILNVYFDAFESDYQSDPFLAIYSHIYQLIDKNDEKTHKEFKENAISALKVVGKASLRVGIKALTAGVLDETILDNTGNVKDASKEASDLVDGFISNQLSKAEDDRKNLANFKEYLAELGKKLSSEKKVIFIIDELDRCKPKFALDLIESIKHLFSVPKITFVLVMNRNQLEEAVRSEYGSGVDAARYLQKFVSIWSSFPKLRENYQSVPTIYLKNCLSRMGYQAQNSHQHSAIEFFEEIITYYDLSLREIEQCLTNFAIIQNATDGTLNTEYSYISVFISVIKVIKPATYRKLSRSSISYEELVAEASLEQFSVSSWDDKPESHPLKWFLKYFMSSDEVASQMASETKILSGSLRSSDTVQSVCAWLEAFQRV